MALEWYNVPNGLSPPTRGNHAEIRPDAVPVGSIPAHAG